MNCIICKKEFTVDDFNIPNGTIVNTEIRYGSKFDGDIIEFVLCDECIEYLMFNGILSYKGNSLGIDETQSILINLIDKIEIDNV